MSLKGSGKGNVPDLEVPELNFEDEGEKKISPKNMKKNKKICVEKFLVTKSGSVFSMFKGLIGQKELTDDSMKPILDKYR